jgi:hypothetical protein
MDEDTNRNFWPYSNLIHQRKCRCARLIHERFSGQKHRDLSISFLAHYRQTTTKTELLGALSSA